ncbi:hypothetical protein EI546_14060 [Aequorivita sp. H23M31]|uniref:Uncharacterized protein n=1 Tax=Aequorivita ciconiae TaxID=2494375 RepID=A0A410G682_9FLAO|nr:hypothetical protein [Aequorivita sp. H23M31]QAA82773.1 hypothetical protein EI546_14060 [Aequorivita sp. H23M31]
MKFNRNIYLLVGGIILLGLNLIMVNWEDVFVRKNLPFLMGSIASIFIILTQLKKIKSPNN